MIQKMGKNNIIYFILGYIFARKLVPFFVHVIYWVLILFFAFKPNGFISLVIRLIRDIFV